MEISEKYILELLKETKKSLKTEDVPVGALIIENNKVISKAHNMREKKQIITKHAELIALEKACKKKHNWHLDDCTIIISMQPCMMCLGAIIQSRIKNIYYILPNEKNNIEKYENINMFKIEDTKYVEIFENMIKTFFKEKRK